MSYNYLFKIVVVGDHNSGKSCILLRFSENSFRQDHISTLGVDFKLKTIKLGRDKVRLELWDTAGLERYRTIYNSYYHSAHGIMCVYDLTNERSFENLENYWLKEIKTHAPQNAVLLLVGNKADLEAERKVDFDRAERLAKRVGVSLYEVSAKTGINCDEAFIDLATAMRDRLLVSNMHSDSDESDHLSSAFHVDGVISGDEKLIGGSDSAFSRTIRCCSGDPNPTECSTSSISCGQCSEGCQNNGWETGRCSGGGTHVPGNCLCCSKKNAKPKRRCISKGLCENCNENCQNSGWENGYCANNGFYLILTCWCCKQSI